MGKSRAKAARRSPKGEDGLVNRTLTSSISSQQENEFIERHGFEEYGKWHLGVNDEKPEDTKARYGFR